jgi:hypothetical protein
MFIVPLIEATIYAKACSYEEMHAGRVGNMPGQALTGLSLAYEFFLSLNLAYGLSNAIFLSGLSLLKVWSGLVAWL